MFPSLVSRVILFALLPISTLGAPIPHIPRQLEQLKGLLGGANGQAANPLNGLIGGAGLDKIVGQAAGAAKQVCDAVHALKPLLEFPLPVGCKESSSD